MSEAFQCDRCGKLHSGEPQTELTQTWGGAKYTIFESVDDVKLELCGDCSVSLKKWAGKENGAE